MEATAGSIEIGACQESVRIGRGRSCYGQGSQFFSHAHGTWLASLETKSSCGVTHGAVRSNCSSLNLINFQLGLN